MNFLKRLTCIIFGHRPELDTVKNIEWSLRKNDGRCALPMVRGLLPAR
jgi:hypothetical protein